MTSNSLQARSLIGAGVFGLAVVGYFGIGYVNGVPITPKSVLLQSLVIFLYLGWLGLGELRRLGKYRVVRSIQAIGILMLGLMLLSPGSAKSVIPLAILAALLGYAFALAMWYRHGKK